MLVSAILECKWCGEKMTIPTKKTTRSFNIVFNKFKRKHDWNCESNGLAKQKIEEAKKVVSDSLIKMRII